MLIEARRPALCAAAVGLVALALYAATMAPGLTWAHDSSDGGELAAAAHTLGIAHPPGYPTYVLLAHPFTLLPFAEAASGTNLFSAVCAAGASAILAWTVARVCGGLVGAAAAGLGLALSPMMWSQAVVTEVHALNAFFGASLLALAVASGSTSDAHPRQRRGLGLAIGIAWGLSLGNHPTAAFYAPLVYVGLRSVRRGWLLSLAGLALGLCIYLLLPLRATAGPPVNWGDPQTLGRFWWMVSGTLYSAYPFALPYWHLPQRLVAWAQVVVRQYGAIGLLVAAPGVVALWATGQSTLLASVATAALSTVFAVGYNTSDSYLYLVPLLICLGLWVGTGVDWAVGTVEARARVPRWATGALALVILFFAAAHRFPTLNLSGDRAPDAFRAAILDQAPQDAIILSQTDRYTFALWYYQHSQRLRPDVVAVDLGLLGLPWYNEDIATRIGVELEPADLRTHAGAGLSAAATALGRPVCRIDRDGLELQCSGP